MIHFIEFDHVSSTVNDSNINTFIIPISADSISECKYYQAFSAKYPDFASKATTATQSREPKPGIFYRFKLDNGCTIYLALFKMVDKFGAYLLDIVSVLTDIISDIRSNGGPDCKVLLPLPTSDEIKLSDAIYTPTIIDTLNVADINIYLASSGEYTNYLESINDGVAYYKRDSWKSDWMLTLDDIKFAEILATVIRMTHTFKISKSSLMKCYYISYQNGMYPKLEFYDTEFGKFFKMFMVKYTSLTNHGLLMNTQHYSKAEPPRFNAILGPSYPLLKHLAYTQLRTNVELINKIAKEIKTDYINSFKERDSSTSFTSKPTQSNSVKQQSSSSFTL